MANAQKLGTNELLFRCAQRMGLKPKSLKRGGIFAVTLNGRQQYINEACSPLNSHPGANLAKNKHLTRLVLEDNGLPNIPFTRPESITEAEAFLNKHDKIIAKPVRGFGAHDIHIVTDVAQLKTLNITGYILEKYIVGKELRYLLLNDSVIAVHESRYGTSVAADRPLQRISYSQDMWSEAIAAQSKEIANLLGLRFAAVDYLIESNGRAHILEVNTNPGLKWFHAPTAGPVVDVAGLFFESLLEEPRTAANLSEDISISQFSRLEPQFFSR